MIYFNKIFSILLGLFFVFSAHISYAQYDPIGRDMLERCKDEGAISFVDELLQDRQQGWKDVAKNIATGNKAWIDVSICLAPGIYFSSHERADYAWATLADAWAQALLEKPAALLERDREAPLSEICSLPLDYRGKSVEFADDFLKKALAVLETVEDNHLQQSKKTCAFHLKLDHERFVNQLNEYKQQQ